VLARTARTTALVILPLALLTACGGGTKNGLSKADYLKKSEAICGTTNKAVDALPQPKAITDLPELLASTLTLAKKATADLRDLGDAQPDKATLHKIFLDPIAKQIKQIEAFEPQVRAAVAKGEAAVSALKDPTTSSTADTKAMKAYGFDTCVTTAETGNDK
jgi:hypothetical protein